MLRFQQLKIAYSWLCGAHCRHCLVDAHPHRHETLRDESVLECLRAAVSLDFGSVEFTGGEIMLFGDKLETFMRLAHSSGLTVALDTNAFWAKSPAEADAVIGRLKTCGLKRLSLSSDSYHAEYIDTERVVNAIQAANHAGIACEVTICITRCDEKVLDIVSQINRHTSNIKLQNVAPFGRAATMDHGQMFRCSFEQAASPCGNMFAPLIAPDGRVSLCCAPPVILGKQAALVSPLILGWLYEESFTTIIKRAQEDSLLNLLASRGVLGVLAEYSTIEGCIGYVPRQEGYWGRCELCMEILGNATPYLCALRKREESIRGIPC